MSVGENGAWLPKNGVCFPPVKSMYEEAIRDGTLEEDVESQEELFGKDYESHMTNILN